MEFSLTASYIQEYPYGDESLYKDCISEVMLKDGWSIRKEVRTEFGIADLVATRGMETWVMEAKISNDNNSIAHACGQLLFYTAAIPFTKRIVATPHKLPSFSGSSRVLVESSETDQDSLLKVSKITKTVTHTFHCFNRVVNAFNNAGREAMNEVV